MRWLVNIGLGLFVLVQVIVTFGAPPSGDPLFSVYDTIRPVLRILHLDTPGRFFTASPIAPKIALIKIIKSDGEERFFQYSRFEQETLGNIYQRKSTFVASLGRDSEHKKLFSREFAQYICAGEKDAKTVHVYTANVHSPSPTEAFHGAKPWDDELIRSMQTVAIADCEGQP